jgi:hypothetical protein
MPEPIVLFYFLSVSTIIPVIYETKELLESLKIFDIKTKRFRIPDVFPKAISLIGLVFLLIPFVLPERIANWGMAFVFFGIFLFSTGLDYLLKKEQNLLRLTEIGRLNSVLSLFFAGYLCGVFWELPNLYAKTGWVYVNTPLFQNIQIFGVPILGFFAYGLFAWGCYAVLDLLSPRASKAF